MSYVLSDAAEGLPEAKLLKLTSVFMTEGKKLPDGTEHDSEQMSKTAACQFLYT